MAVGLPMLVFLAAQAAAPVSTSEPVASTDAETSDAGMYGPLPPRPPKPIPKPASKPCPKLDPTKGEVIVCAEKFEGYRIDPDVLEAARLKKNKGKPRGPERLVDNSCRSVGPQGCPTAGINLIAAALTIATMADRLAKGQEIGSMFITDPDPDEYELYQQVKHDREAKEAAAAAAAAAKAKADAEAAKAAPAQ